MERLFVTQGLTRAAHAAFAADASSPRSSGAEEADCDLVGHVTSVLAIQASPNVPLTCDHFELLPINSAWSGPSARDRALVRPP